MGIATDPEGVAPLDDLDERHHQVTDERIPAGSIGGKSAIFADVEPGLIQDRPCGGAPADSRIEEGSDHGPDGHKGSDLVRGDVRRRQRHSMVREVFRRLGPGREVVVVAFVQRDPGEPMASWSMAGVHDPQKIVHGSSRGEADNARVARTQAAQFNLADLLRTMGANTRRR